MSHRQNNQKKVRFNDNVVRKEYQLEGLKGDRHLTARDLSKIRADMNIVLEECRTVGLNILFLNSILTPKQEYLDAIAQLPETQYARGAERYLSKEHSTERLAWAKAARTTVLEYQQILRRERLPYQESWEKLACTSRQKSLPNKIFALNVARADERVLQAGEDINAAAVILRRLKVQRAKEVTRSRESESPLVADTGMASPLVADTGMAIWV